MRVGRISGKKDESNKQFIAMLKCHKSPVKVVLVFNYLGSFY